MKNRLLDIQEMIYNQMKRIDNDKMSLEELNSEISRSNAMTNNAMTFIKAVNVNIRINELAEKYEKTRDSINKELGL